MRYFLLLQVKFIASDAVGPRDASGKRVIPEGFLGSLAEGS